MPFCEEQQVVPDTSLHELLWKNLQKYGNDVAIVDAARGGKSITYSELCEISKKCASYLQAWGIEKGDYVSICSSASAEFIFLSIGVLACGGIVAPCNPSYRKHEILQQFEITRPRIVFVDDESAETMKSVKDDLSFLEDLFVIGHSKEFTTLHDILQETTSGKFEDVEIDPENDVAFAPHSSGTTGLPKCVLMTHKNYVAHLALMMELSIARDTAQSFYCDRPLYHTAGYLTILGNIIIGSRIITGRDSCATTLLENIEKYRVTCAMCFLPVLIEMLDDTNNLNRYDVTSLKLIVSSGATLPPNIIQNIIKKYKVFVITVYAMTEVCSVARRMIFAGDLSNSTGKVLKGGEVKITDIATGKECANGSDGEIRIRSPQLMKGYLNNPTANVAAFDREGWYRTGDIGHFDEQGMLYVVERLKEIIKYKTIQVSPTELENVIIRHPKVSEVGVIGVPDDSSGEVPKAFVVRKDPTLSIADIHEIVNENLVEYKHLRGGVEFVTSIPKTSTGKIKRNVLKKLAGL